MQVQIVYTVFVFTDHFFYLPYYFAIAFSLQKNKEITLELYFFIFSFFFICISHSFSPSTRRTLSSDLNAFILFYFFIDTVNYLLRVFFLTPVPE